MNITINIKENNNKLEFLDNYDPIVCGNSNYVLKFDFSEYWKNCHKKACLFFVDGNKMVVDFEGDECKVPVMPNASRVLISLISGEGENQLSSTTLNIRLEPTVSAGDFSEFNQVANYLPKILSAINAIKAGDIIAKKAEMADKALNVSNSNILINGDFRINQRGKLLYEANGYTIDRWQMGSNASLSVENSKVIITTRGDSSFGQKIEGTFNLLANRNITLSAKLNGKIYSATSYVGNSPLNDSSDSKYIDLKIAENNINCYLKFIWSATSKVYRVYLYLMGEQTVEINYIKLEVGSSATEYMPRSFSEELALCQRYYQKLAMQNIVSMSATDASDLRFSLFTPVTLRDSLTMILQNGFNVRGNSNNMYVDNISKIKLAFKKDNLLAVDVTMNVLAYQTYVMMNGTLIVDAEIY